MPNTNATRCASIIGAPTGRTRAEDKLWDALHVHPGATSSDLATCAGVGRSTAGKILAAWASEGSVTRTSMSASDGHRAADTWTIAYTSENQAACATTAQPERDATGIALDAEVDTASEIGSRDISVCDPVTEEQQPATSTTPTAVGTTMPEAAGKAVRLGKGALRGLVEDYLIDHAGEQFSPSTIGKALGRSSGAVSNALDKLVAEGYAMQTQDKPKRFTSKNYF